MKKHILSLIMALTLPLNGSGITFNIEHPKKDENGNFIQGRVLLFLSNNNLDEPRFQTNDKSSTAFVFGVNLKSKNSSKAIIDSKTFGYPVKVWTKYHPVSISFKRFYISMKRLT